MIIIGDDCDRENLDYIEQHLPKDKRISFYNLTPKVYHYPDTPINNWLVGPVRALNCGLDRVTGDYIARLDDDDIWLPHKLETLLWCFYSDFISALYIAQKGDGFEIVEPYENPKIGGVQTWLYRSCLKHYRYSEYSWKKDWDKNNDVDIIKRMFKDGVKFGFVDKVVALTLPRPGNDTIGSIAYVKEQELSGSNSGKGWL